MNSLKFFCGALIIFCLMFSCKSSKEITAEEFSKIIFVSYTIKNNDLSPSITVKSKKVVAGNFKEVKKFDHASNTDLLCIQRNGKKILDSLRISNPLIKDFEFVNEKGDFERKRVILDSTEFSVRLQLNPKTKNILIIDAHRGDVLSNIAI